MTVGNLSQRGECKELKDTFFMATEASRKLVLGRLQKTDKEIACVMFLLAEDQNKTLTQSKQYSVIISMKKLI